MIPNGATINFDIMGVHAGVRLFLEKKLFTGLQRKKLLLICEENFSCLENFLSNNTVR